MLIVGGVGRLAKEEANPLKLANLFDVDVFLLFRLLTPWTLLVTVLIAELPPPQDENPIPLKLANLLVVLEEGLEEESNVLPLAGR